MQDNTNHSNKVLDSRFSSYVSNCPSVTERFSKELIRHNVEMSMLKFKTCSSASEKAEAFKKVYEYLDKSRFYSISADSLIRLISNELCAASNA